MIVRTSLPSAALRPFIENLWYHEGLTSSYELERLLPDGAIELIIDLTESPKHWIDCSAPREKRYVRRSWISGQHSRPILIEAARRSWMIGARFRPGGAYPFLDLPVSALNDSVVEMESVWGDDVRVLRERLVDCRSLEERFRVLDRALLARTENRLESDDGLAHVLQRLSASPESVSIRALAQELGVTQKRLVRAFEEKVGLKPKMLARVLRFQAVLQKIERESRVSWSFLAQEAGYYDQSHFIRDFEALSGLTPSRYLVDKGEYLNFVPLR